MSKKEEKKEEKKESTLEVNANEIHELGLDVATNSIYLFAEPITNDGCEPGVEYRMAGRFIKNLNILSTISNAPIIIHMKTNGGCCYEGMAIYDAIRNCPNYTIIITHKWAVSMSSIILQAADKRIMMPNSLFMYHMGYNGISGTPKAVDSNIAYDKKVRDTMMNIYIERLKESGSLSHLSKKEIKEYLLKQIDEQEDVNLTAKEAIKLGFADNIYKIGLKIKCT